MKKITQKGFAHSGLLIVILVLAIVAAIGYKVASQTNKAVSNTEASANNALVPSVANAVPPIKNTTDLNKALQTLNSQKIDSDLNPSSYNKDVSSLL